MKCPSLKDICLFSILGTLMFISKLIMEFLPNVHLLAMLTIIYTVVFRKKALWALAVFLLLSGIYAGFNLWWLPYCYLWPLLWGATMLLPKNMKPKTAALVYMMIAGLHGFLFGTLYAPAQAIMFGLSFKSTLAWIVAGLPFDAIHGISNFLVTALALPCIRILRRLA